MKQHIVLIGFKHVGKSVIGQALALKLNKPFIDLDYVIEILFEKQFQEKKSCREIMKIYGQKFFRNLEHQALQNMISFESAVIAVGGGTPMEIENQQLLQPHVLIHILAPPQRVFERIMVNGEQPAFFSLTEDPEESFYKLWNARKNIYKKLESFSIDNDATIADAIEKILKKLGEIQ